MSSHHHPHDDPLRRLADRVGIIPEYVDQTGREVRVTSDESRVAILAALGIDASTPARALEALERLEDEEAARALDPVRVVPRELWDETITMRVPPHWRDGVRWELELVEESGARRTVSGESHPLGEGRLELQAGPPPALGYHTLRVAARHDGEERAAEQSLIVVPSSCPRAGATLRGRKAFGIIANLYTVRSARSWGIGSFTDLGELLAWTGEIGADFVGVNPLHALRNRGWEVSPYSPLSRLFRNPIYLDIAALPEFTESPEARRMLVSPAFRDELKALIAADRVDYERVTALQRPVLAALFRVFQERHLGQATARGRAYDAYVASQPMLRRFAEWMAGEERREAGGGSQEGEESQESEVRTHPREQVPDSQLLTPDYFEWLQFAVDEQLARAAERGREAGLRVGLYQDLAIGTSPSGADVALFPHLFVRGVSVGAPPDPYSATGQNWGLPPLDPRVLREERYEYWIELVRASLRHAGALRIDHVMGLFRQFWIPEGMDGTKGAYVRFPSEDLLGILALEATRAGALVVGEDLGTVPPDVPPALERWGLLSSKVLYFERTHDGGFRPAAEYAADSLTTANTHDLPTIAGFWRARDVELREEVGLIDDEQAREEREQRERDREELLARLAAEGMIARGARPEGAELRAAVHAFLCRTPAWLVGFALDDLAGEVDPVNVPGVGADRYPSWTRRMRLPVEALRTSEAVHQALRCEGRGARAHAARATTDRNET